MAIYCNDCKYIYDEKKFSCPSCGKRLCNDDTPEAVLLANGYTRRIQTPKGHAATDTPIQSPKVHIDDTDILSIIRDTYAREHGTGNATAKGQAGSGVTGSQSTPGAFGATDSQTTTKNCETTSTQSASEDFEKNNSHPYIGVTTSTGTSAQSTSQSGAGFFAQFTNPGPQVTVPTGTEQPYAETKENSDYDMEIHSLERQRRQMERNYRRDQTLHGLAHFNWGLLFRVLCILGVIAVIIVIWNMRYVILNSIMDFLISLLPLALVVGIIFYLIKSFFKD